VEDTTTLRVHLRIEHCDPDHEQTTTASSSGVAVDSRERRQFIVSSVVALSSAERVRDSERRASSLNGL
jgi:hypothetical protein